MDIEVGNYVRTKSGQISKVLCINKDSSFDLMGENYVLSSAWVVNHSKNKMDIVCVGDYVNGRLVIDKAETYKDKVTYVLCNDDCMFFEEDIRSIVTAEQFASIEYVF